MGPLLSLLPTVLKTGAAIFANKGWKDEFVLILVSLPILLLVWSVFSDDPTIQDKIDIFFDKFGNLPFWYQTLFISIVASIYGLKGAEIFKKK